MSDEHAEFCSQRELIEAFARGELHDAERRDAEQVLEESEPCREFFRQLTAGRYPRLPNYTIIGQVGKGGFGVVYKAIHHAKERIEALKVLFSKTPLLTEYFEKEVHFIARLRHPNIATLFDAQTATPPLYYTMEFVEGERLNDYIKRHNLSLAARIEIIRTVAQAVGYAHSQGVVHRDLKPQNILMDEEGQPHIIDFGIAKKLALVGGHAAKDSESSVKGHEGPVGTLGYIAPEQKKGDPVDERADIFALGALLFHCVTGEPARLARVDDQRMRILRERQVVRPEDLATVIERCVEESPQDRYASCDDLIDDLGNYTAGRPIKNPSLIYKAFRGGALVLRDWPTTVRFFITVFVAVYLIGLFWGLGAHVVYSGGPGSEHADRTVMIGFTDATLDAIDERRVGADLPGLSRYNPLSWRMLYGRLMERLAEADPLVIVWDGYFTKCSAEYDDFLKRGFQALDAPVIVGALQFYANGDPDMCEAILAEVDGCGALFAADTAAYADVYQVVYCVKRGHEVPIPGLALAAYAATRYPDRDRRLRVDLDERRVYLQYRKRDPERRSAWKEDDQGPALYLSEIEEKRAGDLLAVGSAGKALMERGERSPDDYGGKGRFEEGDKVTYARVRAQPNVYWNNDQRTFSFERVLSAPREQLKRWFDGRAIVIGHMRRNVPPALSDLHMRGDGEEIFGCQVHADTIDGLLGQTTDRPYGLSDLLLRSVLWCALATILVSVRRWIVHRSLRRVAIGCGAVFLVGTYVGCLVFSTDELWVLEAVIATSCLLVAGSATYWINAVRERQLGLSPSAATLSTDGPTLASTVLAETR